MLEKHFDEIQTNDLSTNPKSEVPMVLGRIREGSVEVVQDTFEPSYGGF